MLVTENILLFIPQYDGPDL